MNEEKYRTVWACQLKADLWGNISFNLPPTKGRIELVENTEYFMPNNKNNPAKMYQVGATVYTFETQDGAVATYEQLIKALEDKAVHLLDQVHYVRYRWEDYQKERGENN